MHCGSGLSIWLNARQPDFAQVTGLERFVGILIGVAADCLLIIFWPLKGDKQQ
jgi:hypothetical protein